MYKCKEVVLAAYKCKEVVLAAYKCKEVVLADVSLVCITVRVGNLTNGRP